MENNNEIKSVDKELSLWALMLFGPFYLGYRGYLKQAIIIAAFSTFSMYLIVDLILAPETEKMELIQCQLIGCLINFIVALKWDHFQKKFQFKQANLNRFLTCGLSIIFFMSFIFGMEITKIQLNEYAFDEAYETHLKGDTSAALGMYFKLCKKQVGEACYNAGLILSDSGMRTPASSYLSKACKLNVSDACQMK